jgi:hypothetical protein
MKQLETAYHEAGHAVYCIVLGFQFENIALREDNDQDGFLKFLDSQPEPELAYVCKEECVYRQREVRERLAQVAVSGSLAEKKFNQKSRWRSHGWYDSRKAREQLNGGYLFVSERDNKELIDSYCKYIKTMVCKSLDRYWNSIERIANELFKQKMLSYEQVVEICKKDGITRCAV